jgi:hypothetical protein
MVHMDINGKMVPVAKKKKPKIRNKFMEIFFTYKFM